MTPQKQLFRHRPAEGQIGDCWRTSFACLLDLEPAQVPHFVDGCWEDSATANANARAWLAERGLGFVEIPFSASLEDVLATMGRLNPETYYLLGGTSARGCGHSVICCNDQIVWDPSLEGEGAIAPMSDGHFWITYLVPLAIMRKAA